MNLILVVSLSLVTVVLLFILYIYNSIITLRNDVTKSYSGIDVQLKRRSDLIPNLLQTVKSYTKYESDLFNSITKARSSINNAASEDLLVISKESTILSSSLNSLFGLTENYPELKANTQFLKFQKELVHTEDQIAAARRIYNENVTYYNTFIQRFPNSLLSKLFNFNSLNLFK